MRVEEPKFDALGEVAECSDCPFELLSTGECAVWVNNPNLACPTLSEYQSACALADANTAAPQEG